jgi:thymidine kinase
MPPGQLTVITGSMFSGKTEELIRRVRRAQYAHHSVQVFKPLIDVRGSSTLVRSHNGSYQDAVAVVDSAELLERVDAGVALIAAEEVQFFDDGITAVFQALADRGHHVIAAGLDLDFRGLPFGPLPQLLATADEVIKLRAICTVCGMDASRSQRLIDGRPAPATAPTVFIGAAEQYEARCRHHHVVPAE